MFNRFRKDTILVSLFFSNGWTMKSDAYRYQVSKKTLDKDIVKELTEKYNGKWHVTSIARNDKEIYNRFKQAGKP